MSRPPVFIVGCPRSGTTLLYSMLLAAGGFVAYRKETHFYAVAPRFTELTTPESQETFLRAFLQGKLGKVPGLDVEPFARAAVRRCRTPIEFLPIFMDALASAQRVDRWIEATPIHVLYMHRIKQAIPNAVFVHVIRDGRDCALSIDRQRYLPTLPWDTRRSVGVAAVYWEWMVRNGRAAGSAYASQYMEVRFEELIADPRATLARLGSFLDHDLDYDRVLRAPVHSLRKPNTSFPEERARGQFAPVGRWKNDASADDVRLSELLVGSYLEELGYARAHGGGAAAARLRARAMRVQYLGFFAAKHWFKTRTPIGPSMINIRPWARQPKENERPIQFDPIEPL